TDRSISPVTITSVIGSAISATSIMSKVPVVIDAVVKNCSDRLEPTISITTISAAISVSQRTSAERAGPRRAVVPSGAAGGGPPAASAVASSGTASAPLSKGGVHPQRDQAVERDRGDQQ